MTAEHKNPPGSIKALEKIIDAKLRALIESKTAEPFSIDTKTIGRQITETIWTRIYAIYSRAKFRRVELINGVMYFATSKVVPELDRLKETKNRQIEQK